MQKQRHDSSSGGGWSGEDKAGVDYVWNHLPCRYLIQEQRQGDASNYSILFLI